MLSLTEILIRTQKTMKFKKGIPNFQEACAAARKLNGGNKPKNRDIYIFLHLGLPEDETIDEILVVYGKELEYRRKTASQRIPIC